MDMRVLRADAFHSSLVDEIRTARSFLCAALNFDDQQVTEALVRRLQGRAPFECRVVVDRCSHDEGVSKFQKARLRLLQRNGGEVVLADGHDARGVFGPRAKVSRMHVKAVILDNKFAYVGSANVTRQARVNREIMVRMQGPTVSEVTQTVLAAFNSAVVRRV